MHVGQWFMQKQLNFGETIVKKADTMGENPAANYNNLKDIKKQLTFRHS